MLLYSVKALLHPGSCGVMTRRWFAVRKGKRTAMRLLKQQQKKEKAKVEQPAKFVPHNERGERQVFSIRKRVREEGLRALPAIDNVWVMSHHVQQVFPLREAVAMHRETHHPEMFNKPDALIHATVELDTRLVKKNRYLENFNGTLLYPNLFTNPIVIGGAASRNVLVLCKSQEGRDAGLAAGAETAGGADLIKKIQKGEFKADMYKHVVAHTDILQELTAVRGLLSKRFPTLAKGNLGPDVAFLVRQYLDGVDYASKKDTLELDFGWVDAPFGTLDMPDNQLDENLGALLSKVEEHRPKDTEHPFVTRLTVWSPPSSESFVLPFWEYLTDYRDPRLPKQTDEEDLASEEEEEEEEEGDDSKAAR